MTSTYLSVMKQIILLKTSRQLKSKKSCNLLSQGSPMWCLWGPHRSPAGLFWK